MKAALGRVWNTLFYRVPKEYAQDLKMDSLEKNLRRFSILPFFNVVTQLACIFIYLYVYPTAFPELTQVDPGGFLIYTAVYCAINLAFVFAIISLRRGGRYRGRPGLSQAVVYLCILSYVVLESLQISVELEISGNIYRFLATFFIITFFPVVGRRIRFLYMTLYILISEASLFALQNRGVAVYSYVEILILVYVVCLVAANVYYNGVIKNFELRKRLEFLSMKDELTGLSNRRSMNLLYEQAWKSALRLGDTIGVLMIDIDRFKNYNDAYGHGAGDECLARVAGAISANFGRGTDITARYGGEEFVVVLPHTSAGEACLMAERVRAGVEALYIVHAGNPPFGCVTCSVGIAVGTPVLGDHAEDLLRRADDALYKAKENGRNQSRLIDMTPKTEESG